MRKTEKLQKLKEIQFKQEEASFNSSLNRAHSLTVGTCFNGVTEIMMRAANGSVLWCPLQPVEVIELIHQLSANVGCHIMIKPRNDFSSWRGWKAGDEQQLLSNTFTSHNMDPFMRLGADTAPSNEQDNLLFQNKEKLEETEHAVMATKKVINKRTVKRASRASE